MSDDKSNKGPISITSRISDDFDPDETLPADADASLPNPQDPDGGLAMLIMVAGKRAGNAYMLSKPLTKIGRDPESEIHITDGTVSRSHAIITRRIDGQYWIEDLGSKMGTFVNGQRLEQCCQIHDRDQIHIGSKTVFTAMLPEAWPRSPSATEEQHREELQRELEATRKIQQEMVPPQNQLLTTPSATIAGIVKPAGFVAGDFWTYVDSGSQLRLLVADVTGHGARPSMLTTVAKSCLDTVLLCPAETLSLDEVFGTMNNVILGVSKGYMAMTAFAAQIDPARRLIDYAFAGHVSQILLRRQGDETVIVPLYVFSTPLGERSQTDFAFGKEPYATGDRLVLFSDGLVEACNANKEMYSIRRLQSFLESHSHLPLLELLDRILEDVHQHMGSRPAEDDITLVLVELR